VYQLGFVLFWMYKAAWHATSNVCIQQELRYGWDNHLMLLILYYFRSCHQIKFSMANHVSSHCQEHIGDFHMRDIEMKGRSKSKVNYPVQLILNKGGHFVPICLEATAHTLRAFFTCVTLKWPLKGLPNQRSLRILNLRVKFLSVLYSKHRSTSHSLAIILLSLTNRRHTCRRQGDDDRQTTYCQYRFMSF